MTPLGIGARDVLALARESRESGEVHAPLLVTGVLAEQLARELAAGGDPSAVRTSGDPTRAAALVRVVAGPATPQDEQVLRAATRALIPIVVVQTGDASTRLPYVLATDIVGCPPGKGFPVDEIARALAAMLGRRGAALASSLPVLRAAFQARRARDGAFAVALAALRGGGHPALGLAQTRMLADIATAGRSPASAPQDPRAAAEAVALPLAASLGSGLVARALVRRLPVRHPLLDAGVAGLATLALASLARRAARA